MALSDYLETVDNLEEKRLTEILKIILSNNDSPQKSLLLLLFLSLPLMAAIFFFLLVSISLSSRSSSSQPDSARNVETFYRKYRHAPSPQQPDPDSNPLPLWLVEDDDVFFSGNPTSFFKGSVFKAVMATAVGTLFLSGFLFVVLHKYLDHRRRSRLSRIIVDARPLPEQTGEGQESFRRVEGTLKGLVVDENGTDVLYWRKVDQEDNGCLFKRETPSLAVVPLPSPGPMSSASSSAIRHGANHQGEIQEFTGTPVLATVTPPVLAATNSVQHPRAESNLALKVNMKLFKSSSLPSSPLPSWTSIWETSTLNPPPQTPPLSLTSKSGRPAQSPEATTKLSIGTIPPPPPPEPPVPKENSAPPPPQPPEPPVPKGNSAPPPPPKGLAPPPPPPPAGKGPSSGFPKSFKAKGEPNSTGTELQENFSDGSGGPVAKLKPLHWDKVPANADHSMVWDRIGLGSFKFDDSLMEALFGYTAPIKRRSPLGPGGDDESSPPSKPDPSGSSQTFLLEPRKSQNIAIVLRSLGLSCQGIVDSLIHGNGLLQTDILEKLSKIAPSPEEQSTILSFSEDSVPQLADAESFLWQLLVAVPTAFRRVDVLLFRSSYEWDIITVKQNLQTLELACKELRNSGLFLKLLEAVLKAGNRMNAGTSRGNAKAFNLASLGKLGDVKSTDGKTTLLNFVVQEVVRSEGKKCLLVRQGRNFRRLDSAPRGNGLMTADKEEREWEYLTLGLPVVGSLNAEFADVKTAAGIDSTFLSSCCDQLMAQVCKHREFLKSSTDDNGDFREEMKGFLENAVEELKVVKEEEKMVMEIVKRTTKYYYAGAAVKDLPVENMMQLFVVVKDFLNSVDQVCVEIRNNLQKRRGGGAPQSTTTTRSATRFHNLPAHFLSDKSSSTDSEDEF